MDLNYKLPWQQLARHLIDDLVQNPGMTLPGMRAIALRYNATRRTVEHALRHLEDLDVIAPAEHGKKRQINLAKLRRAAALQGRVESHRIFFVSNSSPANLPFMARDFYEVFQTHCDREGVELNYIEIPLTAFELRSMMAALQPRGVILYTVPPDFADEVARLQIPAIGIGTICPGIPTFNTAYSKLLVEAFTQARLAGHRRITAPIWGRVGDAMYERLTNALEEQFSEPPVSFSRQYNLPLVDGETVQDQHAVLRDLFRYTPPTCLILGGVNEYMSVASFCLQEGLRIPADLSVIVLSDDPMFEQSIFSIAHFVLYSDDMMTQAFHLLQEQMSGLQSNEQVELSPIWVAGDSLAAPKVC